jgi:hypothetical protein
MGEIRSGISGPISQPIVQTTDIPPTQEGVQPQENVSPYKEAAPIKAENAVQLKTEQNNAGTLKQTELNKKLSASSVKEFSATAGNDQLNPIGVNRQVLDGETITQFPNGVRITRSESPEIHSTDVRSSSGNPTFQKAGSNIAINVVPPPGGKVDVQKDGNITIKDSSGKAVAFMDAEGNLSTKTKQGDYKQSSDGKIRFTQNGNTAPEALRKPGEINPKDFENYGITTDGEKIRFPNGVEYDRTNGPRVPAEIGKAYQDHAGHTRLVAESGIGLDGSRLYFGDRLTVNVGSNNLIEKHIDRGTYHISTNKGTFEISADGKISFEASKVN